MKLRGFKTLTGSFIATVVLSGCNNVQNIKLEMSPQPPRENVTSYSEALPTLGMMSKIYNTPSLYLQVKNIRDETGTSIATSAEIPQDITVMTHSALNKVEGNVRFIPEAFDYIINSANTGYYNFDKKLVPHAIVSGGITEFDRALVIKGKSKDLGLEVPLKKKNIAFEWGNDEKHAWSRISVDFNLLNYEELAGDPGITATHTVEVEKGLSEESLGFSIAGNTIGLKGTLKKVQGRHAAVRLLVERSMCLLIGRKLLLPYWRALPNATPDPWVIRKVKEGYLMLKDAERVAKVQELLVLHGHSLEVTGVMDRNTARALADKGHRLGLVEASPSTPIYWSLFETVPLSVEVLARRGRLNNGLPMQPRQAKAEHTAASDNGDIEISSAQAAYNIGDPVQLFFRTQDDLHVRLVAIEADGNITTLFPNPYQPIDRVRANDVRQIPPRDSPIRLQITGPPGIDRIYAFTSPRPFDDRVKWFTAAGELTAEAKAFEAATAMLRVAVR